jgi:hypothetical protein
MRRGYDLAVRPLLVIWAIAATAVAVYALVLAHQARSDARHAMNEHPQLRIRDVQPSNLQANPVPPRDFGQDTALCPKGWTAVAGGVRENGFGLVQSSADDGHFGWQISLYNASDPLRTQSSQLQFAATAVCVKGAGGLTIGD